MTRPLGAALLHPVALASLALLVVNDHVLKTRFPGVVTGKLSDFAGMVVAPLVLAAMIEVVLPTTRRALVALGSALAVGLGFALAKTWAPASYVYEHAFFWRGRVTLVRDATDLVALPMGALGAWLHASAQRASPSPLAPHR